MQIEIPGTSAQADIEAKKVFGLNAGDSLVVTSKDGKSRAILRRLLPTRLDSVGGFQLRSVVDGRKFTKTIKLPCPPQKYLIPPPEIIYKVPLWVWIAFGGLGTALGYQTFRRLF